jgi:DNA-binding PadR family transcriptional regulator
MKGDRLGEFEELTLLAVVALKGQTYGVPVQQFVEKTTGRNVAMGAVYQALDRLEDKGYLRSVMGPATPVRGGRAKRLFEVTPEGRAVLRSLRRTRERIWRLIEEGGGQP